MARIRTSVLPVNPFSKYTLKQLHEKIKNYNIQNYSKMKKAELTEYLNQRYVMNNDILVLKTAGFPSQFQMNQPDELAFNPDVFSNENEQMLFNEPPVYSQRPTGKGVMMPATKGNRKTYPDVANRKKPVETKTMRVRKSKN